MSPARGKRLPKGPTGPWREPLSSKWAATSSPAKPPARLWASPPSWTVDGDNLAFTITVKFQDNEMKLNYKGKVNGDEIKFTAEHPNSGQTLEWHAKKDS